MRYPSVFLSLEEFKDDSAAINEFFSNPALDEQFPEMKEDLETMASLESYIGQLADFDARMKKARGISRGMALELKELIPDLESFNPRHYTEEVSGIRYQVSLEEISVKIWALIAAAAALVLTMIYKFISWLTGGSSSGGGGGGSGGGSGSNAVAEAKAGLKLAQTNTKEQARLLAKIEAIAAKAEHKTVNVQVPAVQDHHAVERSHIPQAAKDEIIRKTKDSKDSAERTDEVVNIVIQLEAELDAIDEQDKTGTIVPEDSYGRILFSDNEEAVNAVIDSFNVFGTVAENTMKRIVLLDQAIGAILAEGKNAASGADEIDRRHGVLAAIREEMKEPLKIGSHTFTDIGLWQMTLNTALIEGKKGTVPEKVSEAFARCAGNMDRLSSVDWECLEKLFDVLQKGEEALKRSKEIADEYAKLMSGPNGREDLWLYAHDLKVAQGTIQTSINALMLIYSTLSRVYSDSGRASYLLLREFGKHLHQAVGLFHKYEQTPPPDLMEMVEFIDEALKQMQAHPIHRRFLSEHSWKHFMPNN